MDRGSVLFWIGLLCCALGVILSFSWDHMVHSIMSSSLPLTPTSKTFPPWRSANLTVKIYLFNWTNPEKLLEENYVPEFVELGPYSFIEVSEKVNITWNANDTITYVRLRHYYFDPENSNGTLKDNITMLNTVPLSASYISRHWSPFTQYTLSMGMQMLSQVWVRRPVHEVLFDGYDDPLIKLAHSAPYLFGTKPATERMAWFAGKNGSIEQAGAFNVFTATDDLGKMGQLHSWRHRTTNPVYEGECAVVKGSGGDFFTPGQTKTKSPYLFSEDMCRTMKLDFLEETSIHGFRVLRYEGSAALVDNGTADPATACGCAGECLPAGVYNLSGCSNGGPIFLSYPHFLHADPVYLSRVRGLKPVPEAHRLHLSLEPLTGVPLEIIGRIQLNVLLQPNPRNRMYRDMPKIMFPMLWFEQGIMVASDQLWDLWILVKFNSARPYFCASLIVLGLVLLAVAASQIIRCGWWRISHILKRRSSDVASKRAGLAKGYVLASMSPKEATVAAPIPERSALLSVKHHENS